MKVKLLSFIVVLFSIVACNKEEEYAYSNFLDPYYKPLNEEVIYVDLGTKYPLIIESGYDGVVPEYLIQLNSSNARMIDPGLIVVEAIGNDEVRDLFLEKVRVNLEFDPINFRSGDKIKIICRHTTVLESIQFEIN